MLWRLHKENNSRHITAMPSLHTCLGLLSLYIQPKHIEEKDIEAVITFLFLMLDVPEERSALKRPALGS